MTSAATGVRCQDVPLPTAHGLTWDQAAGRACYACGKLLSSGAVLGGLALGRSGAHRLDTEVWACPDREAEQ
ncbi:hypothetical protein OG590_39470 (plasmid) [Streptomyces goshikiensis]|uniref:hypothetical protein n=1 Tax=Streptomyces goshikiensis TaxID=1942 RepID=UPI002F90F321|nr:hypothetical protein OG590_39470 [Streptomyces goshikiensis]